jgi:DNA mismatch endonuclease (patch repair protein)
MKKARRRPRASSEAARHRMKSTRQKDTPGEITLRRALRALGIGYRVDVTIPGTRCRADVAFVRRKVAVFVDGCFWHGCPEHGTWPKANGEWWRAKIEANRRRDRNTDDRLRTIGWRVLRFWEHEDLAVAARTVSWVLQLAPTSVEIGLRSQRMSVTRTARTSVPSRVRRAK